ncbi:MAG: phosphoribosylanthranilate isomerase [Flavobacteriales bacterium]|nr:phosphoribosylanthranilate isomerase [Flavobacteriales bacterium]
MLIKVCGMHSPDQVKQVEEFADYVGFIFYKHSQRFVESTPVVSKAKKVGVFVNASLDEVRQSIAKHSLDVVQLHGNETPEFCQELKTNVEIIKAFGVQPDFSFAETKAFEAQVDFFLFDTKTPGYGGSGKQFDWSLLSNYQGETPFILSGGLHPNALEEIQNLRHPQMMGLDLNSGFEIAPANKDVDLLRTFILQLKQQS